MYDWNLLAVVYFLSASCGRFQALRVTGFGLRAYVYNVCAPFSQDLYVKPAVQQSLDFELACAGIRPQPRCSRAAKMRPNPFSFGSPKNRYVKFLLANGFFFLSFLARKTEIVTEESVFSTVTRPEWEKLHLLLRKGANSPIYAYSSSMSAMNDTVREALVAL